MARQCFCGTYSRIRHSKSAILNIFVLGVVCCLYVQVRLFCRMGPVGRHPHSGSPAKSIQQKQLQTPDDLSPYRGQRYLILQDLDGQGAGNHMHGLLAAHLLADESARILCIGSGSLAGFLSAFQPLNTTSMRQCSKIISDPLRVKSFPKLWMVNYYPSLDECKLQDRLSAKKVLAYRLYINTYPRWPTIPPKYFLELYQPRPNLLQIIPFDVRDPPKTVVHLRTPDDPDVDFRRGLDYPTFEKLGKTINNPTTYLVTNRVEWFAWFETNFGWSHPKWAYIQHSMHRIVWSKEENEELYDNVTQKELQNLALWSDWYALILAEQVYHTHSDFSLSAIHWMNTWSRTIQGINSTSGSLLLEEEYWIGKEEVRLIDRQKDTIKDCNGQE